MSDPSLSANLDAILNASSYLLAYQDVDFLGSDDLRPLRMQLELLKPEMLLEEADVESTIVVLGGTQIVERGVAETRLQEAEKNLARKPGDREALRTVARAKRILAKCHYYDAAREFSRLVSTTCQTDVKHKYVIVTGGGPGVMEAANRGAHEVGAKSIGLNITLPHEQVPNTYITPGLCMQFQYFALRKFHFLLRAQALVIFPGGFGTMDELFDALTLRQTHRMQEIPIILYGRAYWEQAIGFHFLADEGVIEDPHLDLVQFAETPAAAWEIIQTFHARTPTPANQSSLAEEKITN